MAKIRHIKNLIPAIPCHCKIKSYIVWVHKKYLCNATSLKVGPDLVVDGLQELVSDGVAVLDALPRPCRAQAVLSEIFTSRQKWALSSNESHCKCS